MIAKVARDEFVISFFIYAGMLIYSIIEVYEAADYIQENTRYNMHAGWQMLERKLDAGNYSWVMVPICFKNTIAFILVQIVICEICRSFQPKVVIFPQMATSLAYMLFNYQPKTWGFIFGSIVPTYFIGMFADSSVVLWLIAFTWQILLTFIKHTYFVSGYQFIEYFELTCILSWNIMKFLSFMLDRLKIQDPLEKKEYNFVNYCGYMMYLPTLIHGPFLVYDRYKYFMKNDSKLPENLPERAVRLIVNLIKYIFIVIFTNVTLHYLYVFQLQINDPIVHELSLWGLFGFGYLTLAYFYIYYVVCYGTGIAFAKFDGMDPPAKTKCFASVNNCSELCKRFDPGLYEFAHKYIYCSLCTPNSHVARKVGASFLMCLLAFLYSGVQEYLFFWAIFCFICVMLEKIIKAVFETENYRKSIAQMMSKENQARLYRFALSQVYIPFAITMVIFLAGLKTGIYLVQKAYVTSPFIYLVLSIWTYTMVQVSDFVSDWESSKIVKKEKTDLCNDFV